MGRFSFRTVVFAVAIAVQAFATGAMGASRTLLGSEFVAYLQHCETAGTGDQGGPSDHRSGRHDCSLCPICAGGGAPLAADVSDAYLIGFRQAAQLRFRASQAVLRPKPGAPANRARAPPLFS
jgi:hypothetical protein